MALKFTWDPTKALDNFKKHGITFDEATTAFRDKDAVFDQDKDHSDRGNLIGISDRLRALFIVHLEFDFDQPDPTVRIISARKATHTQRKRYEANLKRNR